jgi:hypothetical protein
MFGPIGKKAKPEADIIDITTQQKIEPEGIMKLKEKLGSPEKSSPIDNLKEDIAKLTEREARAYSANIESYRRPIIREMLLKDTKIKLPDEVRESLEKKMDLDKGADPEMDPLRLLNKYYEMDFDKLDELEEIRFTARNETEAADEFLKKGGLEPKKPMVRESLDDEAVEMEETKDLGDMLKDADDDPDMPEMAEGGRIGFKRGGIKALLAMFGKKGVKTADQIEQPDFAKLKKEFENFNKRNRKLTDEDIKDYELDLGDAETWYEEGMTVADVEKLVAERKAYEAKMLTDYKAGRLNPQTGEKGRESFLRKKMEEMEMSGDKRLMSEDEIMELVDIENRRKLNASGGLNYLMGL